MPFIITDNLSVEYQLCEFNYMNEHFRFAGHPYDYITSVMSGDYPPPKHEGTFYAVDELEFIKSIANGGNALDIGANIGNHSVYFSKFLFDKVFSFEANFKNFILLNQNKKFNGFDDNKLITQYAALSDGHYAYKSREIFGNMGGSVILEGEGNEITKKIDDFNLPKIDFIKIDVEGHELKVLLGAVNLIEKDFPDIWLECIEKLGTNFSEINSFLSSKNYMLVNEYSVMKHFKYKK